MIVVLSKESPYSIVSGFQKTVNYVASDAYRNKDDADVIERVKMIRKEPHSIKQRIDAHVIA